jgi:hypothetical protein
MLLTWMIAAVLAGWVAVTILNQNNRTRRLVKWIVSYDVCGLVPVWTFFAPNPGDTDAHLLFRDRDHGGRVTNWREVKLVRRRRVIDLWDPRRRINKALVDVSFDLAKLDRPRSGPGPQPVSKQRVLGFPYLLILNYVSQLPGDFAAAERQFAVAKTKGVELRDQPDILFVSAFHKLY